MQFIDEKQRKKDCLKYDKLFEKQHEKYLKNEQKLKKTSSYLCDNSIHITLLLIISKIPIHPSFDPKISNFDFLKNIST